MHGERERDLSVHTDLQIHDTGKRPHWLSSALRSTNPAPGPSGTAGPSGEALAPGLTVVLLFTATFTSLLLPPPGGLGGCPQDSQVGMSGDLTFEI